MGHAADDEFMSGWPRFQVHGEMQPAFWTQNPFIEQDVYCQEGFQAPDEAILFPWESAATGVETIYMDRKLGPWSMFEQHLDGDIVMAARQYWYVTGDRKWLADVGFPLANGSASFYAARLEPRPSSPSGYDYNVVMGPDEYGFPVKNSAYVNAVVKIALGFAAEAAAELGYTGSAYERFRDLAEGLYSPWAAEVPGGQYPPGGYHPEYEGFPFGSKGKDFYVPSPQCAAPDGCVKQADTILLNFPLGVQFDARTLENDLDFYEGATDPNGPAMTWAMFAINWFDAGNYNRSARLFRRGYGNVRPPFNVWTEYPRDKGDTGATNFITGAGGFLQSVVFGTSGMRIGRSGLVFDPPPPSATGTEAKRFVVHSLHYLGSRLRHEVTESHQRFELLEAGIQTLCLFREHHDEFTLVVGKSIGVPRGRCEVRPCGSRPDAQLKQRRLDSRAVAPELSGEMVV